VAYFEIELLFIEKKMKNLTLHTADCLTIRIWGGNSM